MAARGRWPTSSTDERDRRAVDGGRPPGRWVRGPTPDGLAERVRRLELTINRRLDGALHGDHQGLTPGHGSEPGESRPYQAGDDVRRIDWNVTARTHETHVRDQIADRDLTAWLVVDVSAAMDFGTEDDDKARTAMAAAATVGFLTARGRNRLGAVLVAGPLLHVVPPRSGRDQVRAILSAVATPPPSEGSGPANLAGALHRVGALARRRGFVAVVSDFASDRWRDPLARVGVRHDLLALVVSDPREHDVPPIGLVELVDPATGAGREVRITAAVRRRFAQAAAEDLDRRREDLRRSRAEVIELSTSDDWLASIVRHVRRRRVQAVRTPSSAR
ncbi:DUF58 domain-containing protein [Ilumatobacter sp.]|uniref:DUF58 domain-containing protein n=1 Tax=Ilumatobacter sp. TaxID=1967498 RepID=UPI003B52A4B2